MVATLSGTLPPQVCVPVKSSNTCPQKNSAHHLSHGWLPFGVTTPERGSLGRPLEPLESEAWEVSLEPASA